MPNWITNQVTAPKHVIEAMTNENGDIDFAKITPFPGPNNDWAGICCSAQEAAEIVCKIPVNDHPLIASLQLDNRSKFDIKKLNDASFRQFVGMLENYRAYGYLHSMEFNREVWGTKWSACESKIEVGYASFDTAWECPKPVLIALSKRFPDDEIRVTYADEDIGCNCGTFTLKGGAITESYIAPSWRDQSPEDKAKWKAFARQVKGWKGKDYDEDQEEV